LALEDFTTYTEVDPGGDLTITATKIAADMLERNLDTYVYLDKGEGHFGTTFKHDVQFIYKTGSDDMGLLGFWAVANNVGDITELGEALYVRAYRSSQYGNEIKAFNVEGEEDLYGACILDTYYYCTAERTGDTTFELRIYSDAARTTLLDTLTLAIASGRSYRYVYGIISNNDRKADRAAKGDVENLDLNEGPAGTPMHYFARRRAG